MPEHEQMSDPTPDPADKAENAYEIGLYPTWQSAHQWLGDLASLRTEGPEKDINPQQDAQQSDPQ